MAAMAAILKIYFHFFSWNKRPVNLNLVRSIGDTSRAKEAKIVLFGNRSYVENLFCTYFILNQKANWLKTW